MGMSCRQHALYLSSDEGRMVREVLREHGYGNYRQIAASLAKTDRYRREVPLHRSFMSRVLRGKGGVPEAMIYGLLELVEEDERLHFLRRGTSPIQPTPKDHWEGLFLDYIHQLRTLYGQATRQERIVALQGLEQIVQSLENGKK